MIKLLKNYSGSLEHRLKHDRLSAAKHFKLSKRKEFVNDLLYPLPYIKKAAIYLTILSSLITINYVVSKNYSKGLVVVPSSFNLDLNYLDSVYLNTSFPLENNNTFK